MAIPINSNLPQPPNMDDPGSIGQAIALACKFSGPDQAGVQVATIVKTQFPQSTKQIAQFAELTPEQLREYLKALPECWKHLEPLGADLDVFCTSFLKRCRELRAEENQRRRKKQ